jgi:hypothetical protein
MGKRPLSLGDIRALLIETAAGMSKSHPNGAFDLPQLLKFAAEKSKKAGQVVPEAAFLDQWHELLRTGIAASGHNFANPSYPWFHLTARGWRTADNLSRDPANPIGYLTFLQAQAALNPTAHSYLAEALECFSGSQFRAAAVMIGCAAESLVLELRDKMVTRHQSLGRQAPRDLADWRIKRVLDAVASILTAQRHNIPNDLREGFEAYWLAFAQQIRATRNEAGHPSGITAIDEESVHASFLVFPNLALLSHRLGAWVTTDMK